MDTYNVIQDSELELFGMDGDWGVEKERVYDQLHDIDLVTDPIDTSDISTSSAGQPIPMQHSISMPMVSLPSAPTWAASPLNHLYGHSVPEMHDMSPNHMDHLAPTWAVPTLQYSSYGSSIGAETYFNGLGSDFHVQGAISPSPEFDNSPFLRPHSGPQYWSGEHPVTRAESNASFDATSEERYEPAIERFGPPPNPPESSSLALVHYQINRRTKRLSPEVGPGKKNSRGRKGPLKPDNRKSTHEMRNVGACKACRDRKTKVHIFGLSLCLPTNTSEVRQRFALSILYHLLQVRFDSQSMSRQTTRRFSCRNPPLR
jgi:hypothetical protein